jgi:hypothetical protein
VSAPAGISLAHIRRGAHGLYSSGARRSWLNETNDDDRDNDRKYVVLPILAVTAWGGSGDGNTSNGVSVAGFVNDGGVWVSSKLAKHLAKVGIRARLRGVSVGVVHGRFIFGCCTVLGPPSPHSVLRHDPVCFIKSHGHIVVHNTCY